MCNLASAASLLRDPSFAHFRHTARAKERERGKEGWSVDRGGDERAPYLFPSCRRSLPLSRMSMRRRPQNVANCNTHSPRSPYLHSFGFPHPTGRKLRLLVRNLARGKRTSARSVFHCRRTTPNQIWKKAFEPSRRQNDAKRIIKRAFYLSESIIIRQ